MPKSLSLYFIEAHAIVANEDHALTLLLKKSDLDNGALPGTCELESVGNQVLKNLLNQNRIAWRGRKAGNFPGHRPSGGIGLQQDDDFFDQRIQRHALNCESMTANPAQIQDSLDQQTHSPHAMFDALQMFSGLSRHGGAKIFSQHTRVAANVA